MTLFGFIDLISVAIGMVLAVFVPPVFKAIKWVGMWLYNQVKGLFN